MAKTTAKRLHENRKLSEMRNIGPACEADLNAVGIFTAADLKKHSPEDAFVKLLCGRVEQGRSAKCCNAAYLYAIYGAIHDIDWRTVPEKQKQEFKAFTAELRATGQFSG